MAKFMLMIAVLLAGALLYTAPAAAQLKLCPEKCDSATKCPGKCGCKYNCNTKCKCNGLTTKGLDATGNIGSDCKSYYQGKLHCYTDPNVCSDTKESGSLNMPGTSTRAHWSFEACRGVTKPTAAPRKTPNQGHAGIKCVDYNDHDTTVDGKIHSCHWCYEKVNSAEFLSGDWLSASFDVHMDKVRNNGHGMFHIALTTSLGRSAADANKAGWYEIGVYSNSFFVRRVTGSNRWGTVFGTKYEFGHTTKGSRGIIWIKQNHKTGQFMIGHGRCVGKKGTVLMDWTEDADKRVGIDRFEVQGYVNTHADFNVCHEKCSSKDCDNDGKGCPKMVGYVEPCKKDFWLPKGKTKCEKCAIPGTDGKMTCEGQDVVLTGKCGQNYNTLKCKACPCAGTVSGGVCSCPKGSFKDGTCTAKAPGGFKCFKCAEKSKTCDDKLEYRTGVCGSDKPPFNTWGCQACNVAGTSSAKCGWNKYRAGDCAKDKKFTCEPQPTCKAGEVYKPGATSQDKATCEPCPTGSFMPRDGHQQQQCQQAREKCGDNEYVKENATATANLKCMSHSECDKSEYQVAEPTVDGDRECATLRECPKGTYVSKKATKTSDRECTACKKDTFARFVNLDKCSEIGECTRSNQMVTTRATLTSDLICGRCPDGHEQLAEVPHREESCSETTSSTSTTTTSSTSESTSTTTVTVPKEVQDLVDVSATTLEKVQGAVDRCTTALAGGEAKFCTLPEQCFFSCDKVEELYATMSERVQQVEAMATEKDAVKMAAFKKSVLTPQKVPEGCADADSQCAAYGDLVCKTEGVYTCNKYCGCAYVFNAKGKPSLRTTTAASKTTQAGAGDDDDDDGDDGDDGDDDDDDDSQQKKDKKDKKDKKGTGGGADTTAASGASAGSKKKDDSSMTIAIVIVVFGLVITGMVVGATFFYVNRSKNKAPADPTAFSNPAYDTAQANAWNGAQHPQYAEAGGQGTGGYMDVGPHTRN